MKRGELIWRLVSIVSFAIVCAIALLVLYQMIQGFG
jgi:hypothetical protein